MKIALEARALSRPASGITTYVRNLVAVLQNVSINNDILLLEKGPESEIRLPVWLNTAVPKWLRAQSPDVVHFTKAALPFRKAYPTVVTIYDVIPILFPESQKPFARLAWPMTLRHAARSADHILTISEASKRDIVEQLQVSSDKVTVTPLAVGGVTSHPTSPRLRGAGQAPVARQPTNPYILFLGTIEPRKNIPALIRAFAKIAPHIPHKLVIAGRHYKGIEQVQEEVRRGTIGDRVEIRGFVPSEELPALYAGADLFVWPSIYEGWGFPPQEAMAAGVPVIVSNGGSLPEVVGKAGEIVPFAVDAIAARTHDEAFEVALADRMRAVLTDPDKQTQMCERGIAQAQKNTWEQVGMATLAVYQKVVNS